MEDRSDSLGAEGGERYAYFMIRIHAREHEGPGNPSGIVERLGSGRKQAFAGVDELLRLLGGRPDAPPKMHAAAETGNE